MSKTYLLIELDDIPDKSLEELKRENHMMKVQIDALSHANVLLSEKLREYQRARIREKMSIKLPPR